MTFLAAAPAPVMPVRVTYLPFDWWNIGSVVAGGVGVLLAVAARWVTRRQRIRTEQAIAGERRRTFELEVLRDLLQTAHDSNSASSPATRALLACLSPDDLPLMRLCQRAEDEGRDIRTALEAELDARPDPFPGQLFERRAVLALTDDVRRSMERRVQAPIGK